MQPAIEQHATAIRDENTVVRLFLVEIEQLGEGTLAPYAAANRLILREVMLRAGFQMLPHEWWHFDCAPPAETRKRYKMIP